jgi:hypothetical protein
MSTLAFRTWLETEFLTGPKSLVVTGGMDQEDFIKRGAFPHVGIKPPRFTPLSTTIRRFKPIAGSSTARLMAKPTI